MSSDGMVHVTIDGREVSVPAGTTIFDAANKQNVKIPVLCHQQHQTPVAVCRVCCVELEGQGRLAPSCQRQCEEGMKVRTAATSERVRNSVKVLTELLLADHETPREANKQYGSNELVNVARQFGVFRSRFPRAPRERGRDESSVVIAVDHNACILCDRCVRACNEIRHNEVIGRMGKGYSAKIAFDLNDPMGSSSCVACGECMVSCPTGALTNRKVVGADPWKDIRPHPERVTVDELCRHPLFEGVSRQFLEWNKGSVTRRHFKKGEIICKEGEFGSTAFLIEQGSVEVYLQSPLKHVKARSSGGVFGLLQKFRSTLVGRGEDNRREEDRSKQFIHVDAAVALQYDQPTAILTPKDGIFGEMTCMNNYPRSATVRAAEDVTVLEILRNVLYILQRNKKSKERLDQIYRERAIDSHLRGVKIFAALLDDEAKFKEFVSFLKERVDLVRLSPGEVIFRQGDAADNFYMVRVGFVKVAQRQPGGEHVLSYIGPGGYFGEIGLMAHLPEMGDMAPAGVRVATCSALDHVDLVRLSGATFQEVLDRFPELRPEMVRVARERLEENERTRTRLENVPLGEFVRQGLMEAQSLLVLDLDKCTRCDECTKACADTHDGVTRLIREGLRFSQFLVASSCRSCLDPYCMVGCPVGSIRRRSSREIIIEDWCIGCGKCAENCPYGNINMHPFPTGEKAPHPEKPNKMIPVVQQKATTCDLCSSIDGQPSCVYACPHDAAHRMTGKELIGIVETKMAR